MATRTKSRRKKQYTVEDEDVTPRRGKKSKAQVVKLDLRKTERGKKGGHRYPEGEYKIKVNSAERKTSQSGNTQIVMQCTILAPEKYEGKPLIDRLTLTEAAMFRVGWLLDAIGIKWKNAVVNFPLDKLKGKILGVQLYDDEYSGRTSSKVAEYYSEEEIDDFLEDDEEEDGDEEEDEDEEEDDEDEEDEEEEDEFDEMNLAKLKKAAKAAGIKAKKAWDEDDYREALREADDEEEDDEDLDELDDDDL